MLLGDTPQNSPVGTKLHELKTWTGPQVALERLIDNRGRLLRWIPLVLIIALGCTTSTVAATWSAFGVQFLLVLISIYRSTYNERIQPLKILEIGLCVSYLAQGIIAVTTTLPCRLIAPINVSVVLGLALLSLVVCYPFTIQYAKENPEITAEVIARPTFFKVNVWLTCFWVVLFVIMDVCVWCAYVFFEDTNSVGHIILGVVVPIVIPVVAAGFMPCLAASLRDRMQPTQREVYKPDTPRSAMDEPILVEKIDENFRFKSNKNQQQPAEPAIEEGYFNNDLDESALDPLISTE